MLKVPMTSKLHTQAVNQDNQSGKKTSGLLIQLRACVAKPAGMLILMLMLALTGALPVQTARADDKANAAAKAKIQKAIGDMENRLKAAQLERTKQNAIVDQNKKNLSPLEFRVQSAKKAADAAAAIHRLLQSDLDKKKQGQVDAAKKVTAADAQIRVIQNQIALAKRSLADTGPQPWKKESPTSIDDLKRIEGRVQHLLKDLIPATVGLIIGNARGSGVIISKDGYILTAGHVSNTPGKTVRIVLHDGRVVTGKSLGRNTGIDSGLVKIDKGTNWKHVPMGKSNLIKKGSWCIAIGHPGGYQRGRPPVVRLGRVIRADNRVVWTDCTLVGGDSGGPLFDMAGNVVGIHSRISTPTTANFHVPIDTYHATWKRLASSEDWTDRKFNVGALAGFNGESNPKGVRVTSVIENSPAANAGLKAGDIIVNFDGQAIKSPAQIVATLQKKRPGNKIKVAVNRSKRIVNFTVTLAAGFKSGPFLGLSGQDHKSGASVQSIVPGTAAAKAKLLPNDVITKLEAQTIKNLAELQAFIGKKKAGDTINIEVLRGTRKLKLKLTLGMRG
jgi:serine protease Do